MRDTEILAIAAVAAGLALFSGGKKKNGPIRVVDKPFEPPEPDDPIEPTPDDPNVVLGELTRPTPTIGYLYQSVGGDNLTDIARRALGVGAGNPRVAPYMRSIAASRWNWILFAQASTKFYSIIWDGVRGAIYPDAFHKVNDNVPAAIADGELPTRMRSWTVNPNTNQGAPLGRTAHGPLQFAMLFMPPEEIGDPNDPERNPTPLLAALGVQIGDLQP
jgi:hypothetical protein